MGIDMFDHVGLVTGRYSSSKGSLINSPDSLVVATNTVYTLRHLSLGNCV